MSTKEEPGAEHKEDRENGNQSPDGKKPQAHVPEEERVTQEATRSTSSLGDRRSKANALERKRLDQLLGRPRFQRRDDIIFSRKDLEPHSRDELIEIILRLQSMVPKAQTDRIGRGNLAAVTFKVSSASVDYTRLPARPPTASEGGSNKVWRVKLFSSEESYRPLGLEIHDEIRVGRMTRESMPDLDLTLYRGTVLGVSRYHALIRPTQKFLYLVDMNSTNGTYHNGTKLTPGRPQPVKDGDTISFADVHFHLKIEQSPPEAP